MMAVTWPKWISSSEHVAEAADWVRWKTEGRAKIVLAVGANSIAVAKNRDLDAEDAIVILADLQEQVARALRELDARRVTHLAMAAPPR